MVNPLHHILRNWKLDCYRHTHVTTFVGVRYTEFSVLLLGTKSCMIGLTPTRDHVFTTKPWIRPSPFRLHQLMPLTPRHCDVSVSHSSTLPCHSGFYVILLLAVIKTGWVRSYCKSSLTPAAVRRAELIKHIDQAGTSGGLVVIRRTNQTRWQRTAPHRAVSDATHQVRCERTSGLGQRRRHCFKLNGEVFLSLIPHGTVIKSHTSMEP